MWRLHHYPLCPFSRKVRLVMAEKRLELELVLEHPWDQRPAFMTLSPGGQTPVLVNAHDLGQILSDSNAIVEFLEETEPDYQLLPNDPLERAEARRLVGWFDQKFYADVTATLLQEKMYFRLFDRRTPDAGALRQAHKAMREHLAYIGYLVDRRNWLAGANFSLADIAAAAHLSTADYLAGVDWEADEAAKGWYMRIKSRPTFRLMLLDRMAGLPPPPHYDKLDF
jgi:glutathione S-transferase